MFGKCRRYTVPIILVLFLVVLSSCKSGKEIDLSSSEKGEVEETTYGEFTWPKSDIAALISVPKSTIGHVEWEASYGFVIYVAETSKEDYDAYVDDCWERGFTNDYRKGDDYFWAGNENGYKVTVRLDDNDVMFIRMDAPSDDEQETDTIDTTDTKERSKSGFDAAQTQTLRFCGMEFSFPGYFDTLSDDSTDDAKHYYPEDEDCHCSLVFFSVDIDDESQAVFDKAKENIADKLLKETFDNPTEIHSESTNIAGLSAWSISCRTSSDGTTASTENYSFLYNPDNKKLIHIWISFDDDDASNYDYVGDYQKILASAKLVTASETVPGVRPEFKEAMDSYEAFFDEYVSFMKKYSESSNVASLFADYADYMTRYTTTMEKMEEINEDDLSDEETKLYVDTMNRISQKLLEIA